MIIAPLRRDLRPRALGILPGAAGTALLASLASEISPAAQHLDLGPFRYADLLVFTAYGLLGAWLIVLGRQVASLRGLDPLLDTLATTTGTVLAVWTLGVGAFLGGSLLPQVLVLAVYPTVEVVLVSLAVQTALRFEVIPTALRWVIVSLALLLVLDLSNVLLSLITRGGPSLVLFSGQMFVFYGLAMAASHPSLAQLTDGHGYRDPAARVRHRAALITLTLAPAVLGAAVPASGPLDATVRILLVAALIAIVAARLWRALAELSRELAETRSRASQDPLTGLPNRAALMRTMDSRLRSNARARQHTAAMFLDVDRFKYVNDTFGHDAGDALLTHIARGVPTVLRSGDVFGRLGGDEFVVVATVADEGEAVALAERILDFFTAPAAITPTQDHTISPSIGIALTDEEIPSDALLTRADAAMYQAKRAGRARWALASEDTPTNTGKDTGEDVPERL